MFKAMNKMIEKARAVTFKHIYKEGNRVANYLANFAQNLSFGYHILEQTLVDIWNILAVDSASALILRVIACILMSY